MDHAHQHDHHGRTMGAAAINLLRQYYWVLIIVLFLFLFKRTIVSALLVVFLMAIAIFSTLSTRMMNFNFGVELVTFVTIILAYAYNPVTALIAAIVMVFCSSFLLGRVICPITAGRYGIAMVLCLLTALFSGLDITTSGKILTIVYNILMWGVYAMIKGFSPIGVVPVAVNVVLNFFLFTSFAHPILNALQ